jgi:hypothetical protein
MTPIVASPVRIFPLDLRTEYGMMGSTAHFSSTKMKSASMKADRMMGIAKIFCDDRL